MEVTAKKCPRCGAYMETFKEMGLFALACSDPECPLFYSYDLYESEKKRLEVLEMLPEKMVKFQS